MLEIGKSYTLNASSPYDTIINDKKLYKVVTRRPIYDLQDSLVDVLRIVYTDLGRDSVDMEDDINFNVHILTLMDDAGKRAYVPEDSISELYNTFTGKKYVEKTVGINIGIHESDKDFTDFENSIKDFVQGYFGLTPTVRTVSSSAQTILDTTSYTELENSRRVNIEDSTFVKNRKLQERVSILENEIYKLNTSILETYEDNLTLQYRHADWLINAVPEEHFTQLVSYTDVKLMPDLISVQKSDKTYIGVTDDFRLILFEIFDGNFIITKEINVFLDNSSNFFISDTTRDSFILTFVNNGELKCKLIDYDGNILVRETLLDGIVYPKDYTFSNHTNNRFRIGYTLDKSCYMLEIYVEWDNTLTIKNEQINGLNVNKCPLRKHCLFSFNIFEMHGILEYNGYSNYLRKDDDAYYSDNDFENHHMGKGVKIFKTVNRNRFIVLYNNGDDKYSVKTIDNKLNKYGAGIDTENKVLSPIYLTYDRSITIMNRRSATAVEIKKIV